MIITKEELESKDRENGEMSRQQQRAELKKQARPGAFVIGFVIILAVVMIAGYLIGTYGIGAGDLADVNPAAGDDKATIAPIQYKVEGVEGS